jgi:hypothetical protein
MNAAVETGEVMRLRISIMKTPFDDGCILVIGQVHEIFDGL